MELSDFEAKSYKTVLCDSKVVLQRTVHRQDRLSDAQSEVILQQIKVDSEAHSFLCSLMFSACPAAHVV